MRTWFDDPEDHALSGLSQSAQLIYLRAIRRYMDGSTGLSSVSYRTCKQVLEFIPDQGSTKPAVRVADLSDDFIRSCFSELDRAGLVSVWKKIRSRPPVFFVCLAGVGGVCPKYEPQSEPQHEPRNEHQTKKLQLVDSIGNRDVVQRMNPQGNTAMNTTMNPNISNSTVHTPPISPPKTPMDWAQFFIRECNFQLHEVQTAKTIPMFADWLNRGITVEQVRQAIAAADAWKGSRADSPLLYGKFLKSIERESKRLKNAQKTHSKRERHPAKSRNQQIADAITRAVLDDD